MSTQPNPQPNPKIIVDDDWKSRVQAEKEAAKQQPPGEAAPASPQQQAPAQQAPTQQGLPQLPPASFALIVSTFATEALAALGQIPMPDGSTAPVQLELAKHFIDTLAVLEEKTKGNLTREEDAMLENVLHELRMAFVAISARQ